MMVLMVLRRWSWWWCRWCCCWWRGLWRLVKAPSLLVLFLLFYVHVVLGVVVAGRVRPAGDRSHPGRVHWRRTRAGVLCGHPYVLV